MERIKAHDTNPSDRHCHTAYNESLQCIRWYDCRSSDSTWEPTSHLPRSNTFSYYKKRSWSFPLTYNIIPKARIAKEQLSAYFSANPTNLGRPQSRFFEFVQLTSAYRRKIVREILSTLFSKFSSKLGILELIINNFENFPSLSAFFKFEERYYDQ